MSYCRFSTDCYQSDIYAYDCVYGGITIHVASNRRESDQPRPMLAPDGNRETYLAYMRQCADWVANSKHVPIGLPHDGQTFVFGTDLEAALRKLRELRQLGYRVPDIAIEALESEAEEMRNAS